MLVSEIEKWACQRLSISCDVHDNALDEKISQVAERVARRIAREEIQKEMDRAKAKQSSTNK